MTTPIRGAQRAEWPEQNRPSTTPVEPTDRTRSALDDPRALTPLDSDPTRLSSAAAAAARARHVAEAPPTVDADAVTASIVAAEAAARARLAASVKPT